ncbi:MAG: MerR family DNA-binding transcriptional regulator [Chloroflexi bacterium]|uniref:MerR family transcriptional regulator n=1 Tax=Candidatus Flexifilum breve TaxID=3140694 RepID=UPI003135CB63|nr:MerR family DNA-binding transcriptional regulator [Chloroflexota bacterium]
MRNAANQNFGTAIELAFQYLALIRMERTSTEAAIEFLEQWAAGNLLDAFEDTVTIGEAAKRLNVSVDMLRNWERNGLITVPREVQSGYRLYGMREFGPDLRDSQLATGRLQPHGDFAHAASL